MIQLFCIALGIGLAFIGWRASTVGVSDVSRERLKWQVIIFWTVMALIFLAIFIQDRLR